MAAAVAERLAGDPRLCRRSRSPARASSICKLADAALADRAPRDRRRSAHCGAATVAEPRKVVIDYGGPNVAKPMHVGHLRASIIGESLKRLYRFRGDEVLGRRPLRRLGLPDGPADRRRRRRGHGRPRPDGGRQRPGERAADVPAARRPSRLDDLDRLYPQAAAPGQGRRRLPRPRPQGDGGPAGRPARLPRPVGPLPSRSAARRPGARVRRAGRRLRPVERRERRRSADRPDGRRPGRQGPAGRGRRRPGHPRRPPGETRKKKLADGSSIEAPSPPPCWSSPPRARPCTAPPTWPPSWTAAERSTRT